VRKRQAGIPSGESDAGTGSRQASPDTVDEWACKGNCYHRNTGDRADDKASDAEAEPATVVEINDLERQDSTVAEHVQEDP
jgi:hypothetical protein